MLLVIVILGILAIAAGLIIALGVCRAVAAAADRPYTRHRARQYRVSRMH
jgi:type II secretory pathway pseudopilin PulG